MRGALLMVCSMTAFTVNDACMKSLAGDLPLFQAIFLRSIFVVAILGGWAYRTGALSATISPTDRRLIALRCLFEIGAASLFLSALFKMPIANVTAILQALPLTVTMAGALFLGEAVGWRRWLAILVGFIGVMLIVRPGAEGFTIYSVYALGAVVCVTLRDITARRMSRETPSLFIAFAAAASVLVFSGLSSLTETWAAPSGASILFLLGAGVFIIGGYVFSVTAMRTGEIAFVSPFRYTSLVVALILGLLVFSEWPSVLTLVGSGIVVATGLFTLYREHRMRRRSSLTR